jgi:hypothetical protein
MGVPKWGKRLAASKHITIDVLYILMTVQLAANRNTHNVTHFATVERQTLFYNQYISLQ